MKRISVRDIMTRNVIGIDQAINMDDVVKLMGEKNIGSIVVLSKDEPIGIITIRNLLQIAEKCTPLASIKARDIMISPIITVKPSANLRQASILMLQKGIKKLVVVDNGKLSGLLTTTDIERVFIPFDSVLDILKDEGQSSVALREEFQRDMAQKSVEEIMTKDVKTVTVSMKINQIAQIMNQTKIGSLIVTEGDKAIGIVTDRDIMTRIMNFGLDPCSVTAEEAMDALVTIAPNNSLKSAVEKMVDNTVKKLGVINAEGALVGIITTTDFLVYYRSLLFRPKALEN